MNKSWIIACNTVREAFRKKALYIILIFALVLIGAAKFFSFLSSEEELKMINDISFSSIEFFGFLMAMFGSIMAFSSEIEKRTIYTLLTKPITRTNFIFGKFLGMAFILIVNFVIMSAFFIILLFLKKTYPNIETFKALFLIFLELLVISAISLSLATFSSDGFNVICSSFVYIVGHLTGYGKQLIERTSNIVLKGLADMLYTILPNYSNFAIRDKVVVGVPVSWKYVGFVSCYGIIYIIIVLLIGIYFFQKREI